MTGVVHGVKSTHSRNFSVVGRARCNPFAGKTRNSRRCLAARGSSILPAPTISKNSLASTPSRRRACSSPLADVGNGSCEFDSFLLSLPSFYIHDHQRRFAVDRQDGRSPTATAGTRKSEGACGQPFRASWARRGAMDGQERRNPIRSPPGMAGVGLARKGCPHAPSRPPTNPNSSARPAARQPTWSSQSTTQLYGGISLPGAQ